MKEVIVKEVTGKELLIKWINLENLKPIIKSITLVALQWAEYILVNMVRDWISLLYIGLFIYGWFITAHGVLHYDLTALALMYTTVKGSDLCKFLINSGFNSPRGIPFNSVTPPATNIKDNTLVTDKTTVINGGSSSGVITQSHTEEKVT